MMPNREKASPGRLAPSIVKNAVAAPSYQIVPQMSPEISSQEYAATRVATKFRLTISTARLVCHLAGIGGNHV
jgi:hypothetical protein